MRLKPTSPLGLFAPGLFHPAAERLLAPIPPHLGLITCLALRYERLSFDMDLFDVYGYGRVVRSISSRGYPAAAAVRAYSPLTTHPL